MSDQAPNRSSLAAVDLRTTFRDPDPAFKKALRDAVVVRWNFDKVVDSFGVVSPASRADSTDLVETVLRRPGPEDVTVAEYARLIVLCSVAETSYQMLVQIAFGRKAGVATARDTARLRAIRAHTGESTHEMVERILRGGRRYLADIDDGLLGRTRRTPDRDRIGRAIAVFLTLIPAVAFENRAGPLCVLAWLHWAIGANTVATTLIAQARRADPQMRTAVVLNALILTHRPAWLSSRR